MKPIYLQENFHYTKKNLFYIMSGHRTPVADDIKRILKILNKLKERNILKLIKYDQEYTNLTSEYDPKKAFEISQIQDDDKEYEIMFLFVGVIYISGNIIFICPKYLNHSFSLNPQSYNLSNKYDPLLGNNSLYTEQDLFKKMKIINKVILKYQQKSNDSRNIDISYSTDTEYTRLMLLLFFLHDYFENGLYSKRKLVETINGNGEIDWNRTVNNSFVILNNNNPIYPIMYTRKRVEDEFNYFKELHRCIITECTKELQKYDLLDFFDITGEELSNKTIEDFDDSEGKEKIKNKIQKEMKIQFNTRNLVLLKAMYSYVDKSYYKTNSNDEVLYSGTKTFSTIWEKICSEVFNNRLYSKLSSLPYDKGKLNKEYMPNMKLENIIPKIEWNFNFQTSTQSYQSLGSLTPDIISTPNKNTFIIFDAKYYVPSIIENTKIVTNIPGIGDVNKQFLYQLCYRNFIKHFSISNVANCFIMPVEDVNIYTKSNFKATVSSSLFKDFAKDLVNIKVRFIPADEIYQLFLNNQLYNIKKLNLF